MSITHANEITHVCNIGKKCCLHVEGKETFATKTLESFANFLRAGTFDLQTKKLVDKVHIHKKASTRNKNTHLTLINIPSVQPITFLKTRMNAYYLSPNSAAQPFRVTGLKSNSMGNSEQWYQYTCWGKSSRSFSPREPLLVSHKKTRRRCWRQATHERERFCAVARVHCWAAHHHLQFCCPNHCFPSPRLRRLAFHRPGFGSRRSRCCRRLHSLLRSTYNRKCARE